ncbi:MAG: thiamine pyrophosphate-binding protein [Alphaproteobacteria bacterium]|nr:thiamine pyrophosphate-binding protein [Alphaproteobacteria bacterium]
MDAINAIRGSTAFLSLLRDEGVTHLFGNPGTTELPVMEALGRDASFPYVLGLQESVVIAMADGFGRASGRLTACNVHVAPGLGNAIGAIYNARFTNTPMIVTAGQQEQGHGLTEPVLYAPLVPIAAPVTKWAVEVTRLADLPRIVRRAAKVACTPPCGPVFLSLPGDVLNDEAGVELGARTRIDTATRPGEAAVERLADRLLAAKNPAIVAGHELVTSDALEDAGRLASALGAPVWQESIAWCAPFPSEHPAYMGALSRAQKEMRATLAPHDLLVFLGADVLRTSVASPVEPLPPGAAVVQIGQQDWEMGKNYAAEIAIRADVGETLRALVPALERKGGAALAQTVSRRLAALAGTNWTARRVGTAERAAAQSAARPIAPDWLMHSVIDALPADAIVVNEALTSAQKLLDLYPYRDRYGYHGNASGGIGWGLPAAVGVQLAHPGRPVVALSGDGSAMYSIQALWTAANMNLPVTFVIANNRSYRILKQRLRAFHGSDAYVGMDLTKPEIDFAGLARSFGVTAERIAEPDAIRPALAAALARGGPTLLDVIVDGSVG